MTKDFAEFYDTAFGYSQEISQIIRMHTWVEHKVNEIIQKYLKNGEKIIKNDFSFSQKINILDALGIMKTNEINTIKKFNKLRNKSVHNHNFKLKINDIRAVYDATEIKISEGNCSDYTENELLLWVFEIISQYLKTR